MNKRVFIGIIVVVACCTAFYTIQNRPDNQPESLANADLKSQATLNQKSEARLPQQIEGAAETTVAEAANGLKEIKHLDAAEIKQDLVESKMPHSDGLSPPEVLIQLDDNHRQGAYRMNSSAVLIDNKIYFENASFNQHPGDYAADQLGITDSEVIDRLKQIQADFYQKVGPLRWKMTSTVVQLINSGHDRDSIASHKGILEIRTKYEELHADCLSKWRQEIRDFSKEDDVLNSSVARPFKNSDFWSDYFEN